MGYHSRIAFVVAALLVSPIPEAQTPGGAMSTQSTAPGKGTITNAIEIAAEAVAIDKANRIVTLKGPRGNTLQVDAGPEVTTVDVKVADPNQFKLAKVGDQVEATYTEAFASDPAPTVYQTALADFHPEYRLVCRAMANDVKQRAEMLSALHGNIQDVFNRYGVQIMSPHYFADPAVAKVVPPRDWHREPAAPDTSSRKDAAIA